MTKWIRYAAVILSMMSFGAGACASWIAFTVQPTSDAAGQVGLSLRDPDSGGRRRHRDSKRILNHE